MENVRMFAAWDYVVFFVTVVFSFLIGVFFAIRDRKRNTPVNYFLASGKSGILSVTLSFIVTFQSSLMIVGTPVEVYMYGLKIMYSLCGISLAYVAGALILVPVFHPLEITSVYRYFSLRFGDNKVRYLALFAGVAYNTFYMGSVTFGTCLALQVVMGIPFWATIILYITVATIYTSIGGIKAVIWSDVFQLIMMMTGIFAVLIKTTTDSGSISEVLKLSSERTDINDFRLDPRIRYQFWNTSFGAFSGYFFLTCTQAGIQRIKSTPTVKSARTVYYIAAPLYCMFYFLAAFQGVTLFAYYSTKGCDPVESGRVENVNELVPVAVLDLFQNMPGLAGLFIASLSSAALSTLSSCLSSVSAITYDDVILENYPNISDKKATFVSKIVVLVYGIIGLALAFAISQLSGTLIAIFMAFIGCLDGPSSAIFLLSVSSKRITSTGVFIGGLSGMVVSFWLIMGQTLTGLAPSEKLPPGSTEFCQSDGMLTPFLLQNVTNATNTSFTPIMASFTVSNIASSSSVLTTGYTVATEDGVSGIENLYSISFTLFSFLGFLTTVVVAVFVSVFTAPPEVIDERCLFSFRRHVFQNHHIKRQADGYVETDIEQEVVFLASTK